MAFTPFTHEVIGPVPEISGPCVVYGAGGVQNYAVSAGWKPGAWLSELFTPKNYSQNLGDIYLNPNQVICRLGDVLKVSEQMGLKEFFLRPNGDGKNFNSGPTSAVEVAEWLSKMQVQNLLAENDVEVVIAPLQTLGREWRSIVVDGRVITSSQYRRYGRRWDERTIEPVALAVVVEAVSRFRPAEVFVADSCETPQGMKIVEYNTFNSAGLYACDVGTVVSELTRYVYERY